MHQNGSCFLIKQVLRFINFKMTKLSIVINLCIQVQSVILNINEIDKSNHLQVIKTKIE